MNANGNTTSLFGAVGAVCAQARNRFSYEHNRAALRRLTTAIGLLRARLPQMHVIVAAVLPRGWKAGDNVFKWPNRYTPVGLHVEIPSFRGTILFNGLVPEHSRNLQC